eukprot:366311-Chlamydomonas_euryale.AAC.16
MEKEKKALPSVTCISKLASGACCQLRGLHISEATGAKQALSGRLTRVPASPRLRHPCDGTACAQEV